MKKADIIILAIVAVFALSTFAAPFFKLHKYEKKIERLEANEKALLSYCETYKVSDSLSAAKVNELQLSLKQAQTYNAEYINTINKLKLDKKGLQSIIASSTETSRDLVARLKDSVRIDTIIKDTAYIKHFTFNDPWTTAKGVVWPDSIHLNIQSRDSLLATISVERKKFLFIKLPIKLFGFKQKGLTIISKNPHTSISHIDFITVVN